LAQRLGSSTGAVYLANQHAENAIAAHAFLDDGDYLHEARDALALALDGARQENIEEGLVRAQNGFAIVDASTHPEASLEACRSALDEWRRLGSGNRLIMSLVSAARVAILAGDHAVSASMLAEAVDMISSVGWRQPLGRVFEAAALNAMHRGDVATAAALLGATSSRFLTPRWYVDLAGLLDHARAAGRSTDPDAWDAQVARGAAMTDEEAFDLVRILTTAAH
jgi:hypothetical protein